MFLKLHETFSALGARIISISRDQHDSAVAIISHVPHMVASSLVRLWGSHADERKELLRLAAGGFKDTTRIAAGSPELWCGIAMDNSEAIADGMRELRGILQQFEDAIRDHDEETLTKLLAESTELRRNLPADMTVRMLLKPLDLPPRALRALEAPLTRLTEKLFLH